VFERLRRPDLVAVVNALDRLLGADSLFEGQGALGDLAREGGPGRECDERTEPSLTHRYPQRLRTQVSYTRSPRGVSVGKPRSHGHGCAFTRGAPALLVPKPFSTPPATPVTRLNATSPGSGTSTS